MQSYKHALTHIAAVICLLLMVPPAGAQDSDQQAELQLRYLGAAG